MKKDVYKLPVDPKIDITRSPQKKGKNMPRGSEMRDPQSTK